MPSRRQLIAGFLSLSGIAAIASWIGWRRPKEAVMLTTFPLGFQWPTQEPFLFCVHHYDRYPQGNGQFGPAPELLQGRDIGQDFQEKDGFRMYHGREVPGFPVHPHRGFETITVVRKGYVDHADSMGAAGRYGEGDVQWMTAGGGVQHSEMFPLLKQDSGNTVELFQIWLNLPRRSKMVPAHFTMFWAEKIPQIKLDSDRVHINLIAGSWDKIQALKPPPDSWAADPQNEVAVLLVKIKQGGSFKLPATQNAAHRTLYFFEGSGLQLNGQNLTPSTGVQLDSQADLSVQATTEDIEFLILQARAIGEPTVQHGPFVMNSREEIIQTFSDYQATQFGGWSWPRQDMVHGPKIERFARFPGGKIEKPGADSQGS